MQLKQVEEFIGIKTHRSLFVGNNFIRFPSSLAAVSESRTKFLRNHDYYALYNA